MSQQPTIQKEDQLKQNELSSPLLHMQQVNDNHQARTAGISSVNNQSSATPIMYGATSQVQVMNGDASLVSDHQRNDEVSQTKIHRATSSKTTVFVKKQSRDDTTAAAIGISGLNEATASKNDIVQNRELLLTEKNEVQETSDYQEAARQDINAKNDSSSQKQLLHQQSINSISDCFQGTQPLKNTYQAHPSSRMQNNNSKLENLQQHIANSNSQNNLAASQDNKDNSQQLATQPDLLVSSNHGGNDTTANQNQMFQSKQLNMQGNAIYYDQSGNPLLTSAIKEQAAMRGDGMVENIVSQFDYNENNQKNERQIQAALQQQQQIQMLEQKVKQMKKQQQTQKVNSSLTMIQGIRIAESQAQMKEFKPISRQLTNNLQQKSRRSLNHNRQSQPSTSPGNNRFQSHQNFINVGLSNENPLLGGIFSNHFDQQQAQMGAVNKNDILERYHNQVAYINPQQSEKQLQDSQNFLITSSKVIMDSMKQLHAFQKNFLKDQKPYLPNYVKSAEAKRSTQQNEKVSQEQQTQQDASYLIQDQNSILNKQQYENMLKQDDGEQVYSRNGQSNTVVPQQKKGDKLIIYVEKNQKLWKNGQNTLNGNKQSTSLAHTNAQKPGRSYRSVVKETGKRNENSKQYFSNHSAFRDPHYKKRKECRQVRNTFSKTHKQDQPTSDNEEQQASNKKANDYDLPQQQHIYMRTYDKNSKIDVRINSSSQLKKRNDQKKKSSTVQQASAEQTQKLSSQNLIKKELQHNKVFKPMKIFKEKTDSHMVSKREMKLNTQQPTSANKLSSVPFSTPGQDHTSELYCNENQRTFYEQQKYRTQVLEVSDLDTGEYRVADKTKHVNAPEDMLSNQNNIDLSGIDLVNNPNEISDLMIQSDIMRYSHQRKRNDYQQQNQTQTYHYIVGRGESGQLNNKNQTSGSYGVNTTNKARQQKQRPKSAINDNNQVQNNQKRGQKQFEKKSLSPLGLAQQTYNNNTRVNQSSVIGILNGQGANNGTDVLNTQVEIQSQVNNQQQALSLLQPQQMKIVLKDTRQCNLGNIDSSKLPQFSQTRNQHNNQMVISYHRNSKGTLHQQDTPQLNEKQARATSANSNRYNQYNQILKRKNDVYREFQGQVQFVRLLNRQKVTAQSQTQQQSQTKKKSAVDKLTESQSKRQQQMMMNSGRKGDFNNQIGTINSSIINQQTDNKQKQTMDTQNMMVGASDAMDETIYNNLQNKYSYVKDENIHQYMMPSSNNVTQNLDDFVRIHQEVNYYNINDLKNHGIDPNSEHIEAQLQELKKQNIDLEKILQDKNKVHQMETMDLLKKDQISKKNLNTNILQGGGEISENTSPEKVQEYPNNVRKNSSSPEKSKANRFSQKVRNSYNDQQLAKVTSSQENESLMLIAMKHQNTLNNMQSQMNTHQLESYRSFGPQKGQISNSQKDLVMVSEAANHPQNGVDSKGGIRTAGYQKNQSITGSLQQQMQSANKNQGAQSNMMSQKQSQFSLHSSNSKRFISSQQNPMNQQTQSGFKDQPKVMIDVIKTNNQVPVNNYAPETHPNWTNPVFFRTQNATIVSQNTNAYISSATKQKEDNPALRTKTSPTPIRHYQSIQSQALAGQQQRLRVAQLEPANNSNIRSKLQDINNLNWHGDVRQKQIYLQQQAQVQEHATAQQSVVFIQQPQVVKKQRIQSSKPYTGSRRAANGFGQDIFDNNSSVQQQQQQVASNTLNTHNSTLMRAKKSLHSGIHVSSRVLSAKRRTPRVMQKNQDGTLMVQRQDQQDLE